MSRWLACVAILVVGCGGGGSSKRLVDLDQTEVMDLCEDFLVILGPPRTVECGDGLTVFTGGDPVAECIVDFNADYADKPDCPATVADATTCRDAIAGQTDAQICALAPPDECAPLFDERCFTF